MPLCQEVSDSTQSLLGFETWQWGFGKQPPSSSTAELASHIGTLENNRPINLEIFQILATGKSSRRFYE